MSNKKKNYTTFLPNDAANYIEVYWKYYLSLENEFNRIYSENSIDRYSEVRLYLSIGSEIDVIFKTICQLLDGKYNGNSINEHKTQIEEMIKDGEWDDYRVDVKCQNGIVLRPWLNTEWWTDYNMVKHQRVCLDKSNNLYFSHAEKNNILNALAGLYILEVGFYNFFKDYLLFEDSSLDNCKSIIFK